VERLLAGATEIERAIADIRAIVRSGELERLALRPNEVAQVLGCGRDTVLRWVASGELPSVREGNVILVPRAGLEAWLQRRSSARVKAGA
jgi:excisionase family DNA binding protein